MNALAEKRDPETTAIVQMIERAATNPQVDIDKMERLLAMQERMADRAAEQAFNEAMRAAQEEMPKIRRNKRNQQTGSNYADLEVLNERIVPIYTKHGFSLSFGTADTQAPECIRITCRVSHAAGHSRDYQADVPLDLRGMKGTENKTRTHAFGSTVSYGRRYLTFLMFNISVTDEDDDGNGGQDEDEERRPLQKPEPQRAERPPYPADAFAKNLPAWAELIHQGKKSAAQIIASVESRALLTDEQKAALTKLEPSK